MTRKAAVVMATLVLLLVSTGSSWAEDSTERLAPGIFGIGAGVGTRYGFGGMGLELSPVEYFALTAGAGIPGAGGYAGGIQVFPAGRSWKVRPWLSVTAGTAVLAKYDGFENESFVAYGVGGEIGFNQHNTVELGVEVVRGDVGDFLYPVVGWKHHF